MILSGTPGRNCSARILLAITSPVIDSSVHVAADGLETFNDCRMLMSAFSQAPSEICRNASRTDHQRD